MQYLNPKQKTLAGLTAAHALLLVVATTALASFAALGTSARHTLTGTTDADAVADANAPSSTPQLTSRNSAGILHAWTSLSSKLRKSAEPVRATLDHAGSHFAQPWRKPATFEALQSRLPAIERSEHDIVLMPSLSVDGIEDIVGLRHYEERSLAELAHLHNPKARVHLVTSAPIAPSTLRLVAKQLGLDDKALSRLYTYSPPGPGTTRWLSTTALEYPEFVSTLRKQLRRRRTYMSVFASSDSEKALALELGVPMHGSDPAMQLYWGGKSGSRIVYRAAGVDFPPGAEHLYSRKTLITAISELWENNPDLTRVVIKLDQGSSGQGNALLDLRPFKGSLEAGASLKDRQRLLAEHLTTLEPANENWSASRFLDEFKQGGSIEAFIDNATSSPSVQVEIMAGGEVRVLSTHEQMLAGPGGQVYQGCVFPGACGYRADIQASGRKVGEFLRDQGMVGRFAIDFMSRKENGVWRNYAVDLNIRKGGTTHPYQWAQAVTGAKFDEASGTLRMPDGSERVYIGTDNFKHNGLVGKNANDLLNILDEVTTELPDGSRIGSFFHLVGTMPEHGKVGFTTVGRNAEETQALYKRTKSVLERLASE